MRVLFSLLTALVFVSCSNEATSDASIDEVAFSSEAEVVEAIGRCLQNQGLDVQVDLAGIPSIAYDNRIIDPVLYDETHDRCRAELESDGSIVIPSVDPAFLASVYDSLVDVAECLETAGYTVPEPSSKQAWVESKGAAWDPYLLVLQSADTQAIDDAFAKCPR